MATVILPKTVRWLIVNLEFGQLVQDNSGWRAWCPKIHPTTRQRCL
jgi:hypothetical protein